MKYDLELDKAIKEIKKQKAKLVCIQLPDGLKPEANKIKEILEKNTNGSGRVKIDLTDIKSLFVIGIILVFRF